MDRGAGLGQADELGKVRPRSLPSCRNRYQAARHSEYLQGLFGDLPRRRRLHHGGYGHGSQILLVFAIERNCP
jgi:hypothetical protein